jgi:hypothetical protein
MNTQPSRITKEDVELISLGLNEYIKNVGINENTGESKDIDYMLDMIKKYFNNVN